MNYAIGAFALLTSLSIHTLRYYEKEKLLTPSRKKNGRRCYSEDDVIWIQFIKRLKDTAMPIKEIQQYALLRRTGDTTLYERMQMLISHRTALDTQITKLQDHLGKLDDKIDFYQKEIQKQTLNDSRQSS